MARSLAFLLLALLLPPATAFGGQDRIMRVSGAVVGANYPALEAFLTGSTGVVVGLNVSFAEYEDHDDGHVTAYVNDSEDKFAALLAGADGLFEIWAYGGFSLVDYRFVFDGFFAVRSDGVPQGVVLLEKVDAAQLPAAAIEDIHIGDLPQAM